MTEDSMPICLIAFIFGYIVSCMMRGNGLSVGCQHGDPNNNSIDIDVEYHSSARESEKENIHQIY